MRFILALAFVFVVVASNQAQAPSWESLPPPDIQEHRVGGTLAGFEITFADGSVLRADGIKQADAMSMVWNTPSKKLPLPAEFELNGNVRLTIPQRPR